MEVLLHCCTAWPPAPSLLAHELPGNKKSKNAPFALVGNCKQIRVDMVASHHLHIRHLSCLLWAVAYSWMFRDGVPRCQAHYVCICWSYWGPLHRIHIIWNVDSRFGRLRREKNSKPKYLYLVHLHDGPNRTLRKLHILPCLSCRSRGSTCFLLFCH